MTNPHTFLELSAICSVSYLSSLSARQVMNTGNLTGIRHTHTKKHTKKLEFRGLFGYKYRL